MVPYGCSGRGGPETEDRHGFGVERAAYEKTTQPGPDGMAAAVPVQDVLGLIWWQPPLKRLETSAAYLHLQRVSDKKVLIPVGAWAPHGGHAYLVGVAIGLQDLENRLADLAAAAAPMSDAHMGFAVEEEEQLTQGEPADVNSVEEDR